VSSGDIHFGSKVGWFVFAGHRMPRPPSGLWTGDAPPGPLLLPTQDTARAEVTRAAAGKEAENIWRHVEKRVHSSLPDYRVTKIERLQSRILWRRYTGWRQQLPPADRAEVELFHFSALGARAKPAYQQIALTGFAPQLARAGEYGDGAYFADQAIYAVAYGQGWLCPANHGDMSPQSTSAETSAEPPDGEIAVVWSRVTTGRVKDFGWNCASERRKLAANEEARSLGTDEEEHGYTKESEFKRAYPEEGRPGQERHRRRPPPLNPNNSKPMSNPRDGGMYHSVSGTEGNLLWAANRRLRENGEEFGRQFVTFNEGQAYPEFVLTLRRLAPEQAQEALRAAATDRKSDPDLRSLVLPRGQTLQEALLGAEVRGSVSDFVSLVQVGSQWKTQRWRLWLCIGGLVCLGVLALVGWRVLRATGCDSSPCDKQCTCIATGANFACIDCAGGFGRFASDSVGAGKSEMESIESWLPYSLRQKDWRLCYDSRTDCTACPSDEFYYETEKLGCSCAGKTSFHSACDAHNETVVLAHNSLGFTFGGYAMYTWQRKKDDYKAVEDDRKAVEDFIFRLGPNGSAPYYPVPSDTINPHFHDYYQLSRPGRWPSWGLEDLIFGTGTLGTYSVQCDQGTTYRGQRGECCGAQQYVSWGKTEMEVWYPFGA